jgi:soluble P-type ATPase
MTLLVEIPGRTSLELEYLLLDVNGTLTERGVLLAGIEERMGPIRERLEVRLLSADTFGTLADVAAALGLRATLAPTREAKQREIAELGGHRCIAVGNGANDAAMVADAALGIAVIGPEGAAASLLAAADVVARSITEALDLLLEPRALAASLRS